MCTPKLNPSSRRWTLVQAALAYHAFAAALGLTYWLLCRQSGFVASPLARYGVALLFAGLFAAALALFFRLVRRRERWLMASEQRYKSLYVHHPDSIVLFSLKGEVLDSNRSLTTLTGFDAEEAQTTSFIPMLHPPDLLKALHHFQAAAAGTPQHFEASFLHKQGQPIPTNVTLVPTVVGEQVVGLYAILKDLTESKEQKKEIDKLHRQNRLILNSVSEGIYGIDTNGRTIFWNKAAERMTGWKVDDMLGKQIGKLIRHSRPEDESPEQAAKADAKLLRTMLEREVKVIKDGCFRRKDGASFPVEYMSSPILEGDRHLLGVVITFKDMTEQKKTEELLFKSDKLSAVGQLAAGVAHEIRNPLTALKGFLQLLKTPSPKEQYYIEIMRKELLRIEFIVNEFLFVAKPQAIHFEARDPGAIIRSTVELMQPQALLGNIEIEAEVEPDLPLVSCDEHQLKQVFINVLKNALESMTGGGTMRIAAYAAADGREMVIRFIDHGCGIAPERLPKLGEPFYSTKEKGTGLGLMVCFRIIEAHGGTMRIRSKLDEGTTVEISLPFMQERLHPAL
ncbi:PAS domain S-box protein [Paenibacillus athensensis]|uniref:PAS domain-containing sensor histidine kinase n=1 Tax=Paenibacillus athensensis TaxID=1967502 RepID=UPI00142FEC18|nr:PAS domain-containing sensor histidine kinase [Paenibacillus athensensis]MCD1259721.1 PAS domain S-box protein [Paenibacillus athensensis]